MTSTTRHAGLGTSTDIPDGDFETYSEAGYLWDDQKAKRFWPDINLTKRPRGRFLP